MQPARIIKPCSFMVDEAARRIMAILNEDTLMDAPRALFVGGCVRNLMVGQAVSDIDIATSDPPPEVMARLEAAGIKVVPTGIDHGTVTAVFGGRSFEITTLRRDVETFGRRAVVAYTDDWRVDAQRRDFTMNTLLADTDGRIYDPLGQGLADLEAGLVRFVGDPDQRIAEDYLRILRFFRFHAGYGRGDPDPQALSACARHAGQVSSLSRERVTAEFLRILAGGNPARILQIMFESNVLNDIADPGYDAGILDRLVELQARYDATDITARLVVLAGFNPQHLDVCERLLVLPNRMKQDFTAIISGLSDQVIFEELYIKKLIYNNKSHVSKQCVLIYSASTGREIPGTIIALLDGWQAPVFPLSGNDLKALRLQQGPEIGRILRAVESWWIERDFMPDHAACLRRARELLG